MLHSIPQQFRQCYGICNARSHNFIPKLIQLCSNFPQHSVLPFPFFWPEVYCSFVYIGYQSVYGMVTNCRGCLVDFFASLSARSFTVMPLWPVTHNKLMPLPSVNLANFPAWYCGHSNSLFCFRPIREYFSAHSVLLLRHFPEHVRCHTGALATFTEIWQFQAHYRVSSFPTVYAWGDEWHYRLSRYWPLANMNSQDCQYWRLLIACYTYKRFILDSKSEERNACFKKIRPCLFTWAIRI